MDSCERFWDAFYAAMDRNATTPNGSKEEKGKTATTTTTTTNRASDDASDKEVGTLWHWKRRRRREDEREIRAFERAWEIVDPAVAKASWTRRYGDVFLFDDDDDSGDNK